MTKKEKQRIASTKEAMNQKMGFGKYGKETIAHVAQFDPTYLDWAVSNGLLDHWVITARDRGEYEKKELKSGLATVFTWD
jgi:hypothetical protein